jgi:peptidoglycan/LPS O-acetylase OafA/YrhL
MSANVVRPVRHYYLDNLRSFVVLVVVVFHAAMAFMVYCPSWWPVIDPQQNLFFLMLVVLTDIPIMPVLFMVAGYFAIASLAKKGQGEFWKDKLLRIVLPWILGFLIIAPTSPYIWLVARHKEPSFAYFWLHMFFTKAFNTQGALWFLGVLTVFYIVLSLVYSMYQPLGKTDDKTTPPGLGFLLLFWLVPSAVFTIVNQFWSDIAWIPVKYVLWVQPTRVSLYVFYFALGVYAYRKRWFGTGGYTPRVALWLPLAVVTGGMFCWYKLYFSFHMVRLPLRAGNNMLHCLFCLCTILALLGLFHSYLDWTSGLLTKLAASSYAIYWVHMPIVLLSTLVVRGYHWNIYVKYLAVCALSLVVCFLVGVYVVGRLPMFAGKKPKASSEAAGKNVPVETPATSLDAVNL